jgi:hypothetical protein
MRPIESFCVQECELILYQIPTDVEIILLVVNSTFVLLENMLDSCDQKVRWLYGVILECSAAIHLVL